MTQIINFKAILSALILASATPVALAQESPDEAVTREENRAAFMRAWGSARRGDLEAMKREGQPIEDYLLFPYLEYNELLATRRSVSPDRMSTFLEDHQDWAFTPALKRSWLRAMGERRRWDVVLQHGAEDSDTEVRCYHARARLSQGSDEALWNDARSLWLAGQSQPKACDPLFDWLIAGDGVSSDLAWNRIRLAFDNRHPYLARYLTRFLDEDVRVWAERWRQQDSQRYRRLDRAAQWSDTSQGQDLTSYGLRSLARSDSDRAWQHFNSLDGHFSWTPAERASILREIALWSAVEGSEGTLERMRAVPAEYRDGRLLEWWTRNGLTNQDWDVVVEGITQMPEELRDDDRWRFWYARAAIETNNPDLGNAEMTELASRATYYGFLAADYLAQPYSICPETPMVGEQAVDELRLRPDFSRAVELHAVDLRNWGRSEWSLATDRIDTTELQAAAALAIEEGWVDMAIFALADSGDLDWYEWRFPVSYTDSINRHTNTHDLDPAWVLGLMRSESAMAEDAISSANARGLMQITPPTARQLSRRHGIPYSGQDQLLQPELNIQLGTAYLRDLLNDHGDNPVLAAGAYNAGPQAVKRWLDGSRPNEAAMWIETIPYFETREYIPRVLAFSAIYDWRMAQPVTRVSSRMPTVDSGNMMTPKTTEVVCPGQETTDAP